MICTASLPNWTNTRSGASRVRSRRVSCVLSAAALVVATWGNAHAELFGGFLSATSNTMNGRLFHGGTERTCAAVKDYPGEVDTGSTFRYGTHTFTNTGVSGCVTFKITQGNCAFLSIYVGSFNPANKA